MLSYARKATKLLGIVKMVPERHAMKLSTRSRYGLKAVIDLAIAYGTGPVSLPVLAGSQGISEGYLEQLLRELKKGSVVDTVRGAQGGYELTCDPAQLSVQRVLNLLEGSTAIVDCVGTLHHNCTSACSCSARPLFLKLQTRINDVLERTTIRELADDYLQQKARGIPCKNVCDQKFS